MKPNTLTNCKIYITDIFHPSMLDRSEQSSSYYKRYPYPLQTVRVLPTITDRTKYGAEIVCKITDQSRVELFNSILNIDMVPAFDNNINLETGDIIIVGDILTLDRKPYPADKTIISDTKDLIVDWWVI